jgi:hypothetical protein
MIYKHRAVTTGRNEIRGAKKAGYQSADAPHRVPMYVYNLTSDNGYSVAQRRNYHGRAEGQR